MVVSTKGFYGDSDLTRYLTASVSEVERKTFGSLLLDAISTINLLKAVDYYRYETGNGFGSTNTRIRRFQNANKSISSGLLSISNTATNGFEITALKRCAVKATYTDQANGASNPDIGFSLNSGSLTTDITGIPILEILSVLQLVVSAAGGHRGCVTTELIMEPGDVLRPHVGTVNVLSAGGLCEISIIATPIVS
jgi:hypothetical protein